MSVLPLLETGVTHVIIAAFHLNSPESITLNDDPYEDSKYEGLWTEVRSLQKSGVKVLGMLGGAAHGSFVVLDSEIECFEAHYQILHRMIERIGFDGLDLDMEEAISLAAVIRLINRLKTDFGPDFLITLAPIATAMRGQQNLSGFDHEALEKAFAIHIAWYNTQFYCGWGRMDTSEHYEKIINRGCWPASKIVAGLVTNPDNCKGWVPDEPLRQTLMALKRKYPDFGGVMGWEYFNSMTEADGLGKPWCWAKFMTEILHSADSEKC